jgi:hypothetical protein
MATGEWESLREASFRNVTFFLVDKDEQRPSCDPRAYPKKKRAGLKVMVPC